MFIYYLSRLYLKAQGEMWQMRCAKWNPWWKREEETHIVIACISFPELPPNFFGKEFVFSLSSAVGRPLHGDLYTQNGTILLCKGEGQGELISQISSKN